MILPLVSPGVICKPMSDGAVLFSTRDEVYFGLNTVGARVWELLPPACESLDELCETLAADFVGVAAETIREDVIELLEALTLNGLVERRDLSTPARSRQTPHGSGDARPTPPLSDA